MKAVRLDWFQRWCSRLARPFINRAGFASTTDWAEERAYWRSQYRALLSHSYHLSMDPIQDDDVTSPSAGLVRDIQDPDKAIPDAYFATGFRTAFGHLTELADHGFDPTSFRRVLELGVGLGRLIRHYYPFSADLHGCDVTRSVLCFVRSTLGDRVSTVQNHRFPPLPYEDKAFDFVFANSVFTHIRPAETRVWIGEIHRVVAPGGCAIVSLLNPNAHLSWMAPRDFHRRVEIPGSHHWGRADDVRENFSYMTDPVLFHEWGSEFEILELRRNFREQDHLILRRPLEKS